MARKIDGFDWRTFKYTDNTFAEGFKKDFTLAGELTLNPIFF